MGKRVKFCDYSCAEVDFKSGWADINIAITARKRKNGEYVIFAEEDGYGKILMYRWCELGNCIEETLSSTNSKEDIDVFVYPNPSDGNFTLQFDNLENRNPLVLIYDHLGLSIPAKGIITNISQSHVNIDLSNLSKGIYCIEVIDGQFKTVRKVIVR